MLLTKTKVIILLLFTAPFIWHYRRRRKHPPGPLGFPIFGMLPFQMFEMIFPSFFDDVSDAENFRKYKEKYGPLWSVEYGGQRMVTLSSWDLINEAFIENDELFSGRPTHPNYKLISHGRGIVLTDGEMWRGHRQLAIRSLKDLGMGSKVLESLIIDEAENLMLYLETLSSSPVNMFDSLSKGVSNVMTRLIFHERTEYDDPEFMAYVNNLRIIAHSDRAGKQASIAPGLFKTAVMRKIYPDAHKFLMANDYCYQFIRRKCEAKMETYSRDVPPNCVFDYFKRDRFQDSSSITPNEQHEEILQSVFDLFNAGVDSTSNLLSFCCLMLGRHEDVQRNIRSEIKELAAECSQINMDLRKSCPKMLSFIDEVHRFCCVFPKVHHRVMNECIFHGYKLHPDDIIFGDLVNVLLDPTLFENPHQFNPYRFMDESMTKYCPSQYLIPFGLGKRSCMGHSIANMEIFLFLERLIHRFKITLPKEVMERFDLVIRGHSGIIHAPLSHEINISDI